MGVMACLVFTAISIVIISRIKNPERTKAKYPRSKNFNQAETNEDDSSNLSDIVYNNQAINLKFSPNNNFNATNTVPSDFYTSKFVLFSK